MTRVWLNRPHFLHLAIFFVAYVMGCGFAQVLAIVPGTGISIWPPSGLFMATLILGSRQSWPWWVLAGCLAELFSNFLWFNSPLPAALLIYLGNASEAATGAWLVTRILRRPVGLETLPEVLAFVVLGAGVAPVIGATVGSATLAWFGVQSQTFAAAWPLFWIGDATGILIVAPLVLVVFQNWRGEVQLLAARWIEASVVGLIFLGVAALSLSGYLPFAYIVMPPLLWAAVRFEFKGAAITLALLALITTVFTISGVSQFAGDPESQRQKQIMLQLFLAISAFSALIVAAISRQHQQALLTLRQSVETLREREGELSQLVDLVPSHVWRLAPNGEPIFFNKRMVDFIGRNVADMDKPGITRLAAMIEGSIHPDDAAAVGDALRHSLATGESFAMRYRLRRADGIFHWMSTRAEPLRDHDGRIVQWYGLCHDVDDQTKAEEALRRSERQLQEMIDALPVRIWSATPAGETAYFNKRYKDHFRAVIPDFEALEDPSIERLMKELVHPEDAPKVEHTLKHCFETGGGSAIRFRWLEKDGAYRWAECRVESRRDEDGTVVQWYGASIDIDDEVRAQQALQDRERELSQLVNMVPSFLWRLNPDGEPTFFNRRLIDFFGLDIADADRPGMSRLGSIIETAVHPDDAAGLAEALNNSFVTGERFSKKYRLRRADGVYRWVEGSAEPLRDGSGRIVQWYGLSHDIDDRLRAEEALRRSERSLQQVIDTVPVLIFLATPAGDPIYANKRLTEFHGFQQEEFDVPGETRMDRSVRVLVHPDDRPAVHQALKQSFSRGEPFAMRYRQRRYDGVYRWIEGRAEPLRNDEGEIVQWYGVNLDVDDEVRAQEALRQASDKLARAAQAASLAELSASIAHEVNQPLAAIVANSHACHRWLSAAPPNVERAKITAERIIRDANSAADVVSRIRALFRQSAEPRNSTTLPGIIAEARNLMAEEAVRRRVRLDVDVESDLPSVALDRVQIQQVLINLIRNGMEAMDSAAGDKVIAIRVRRMGDDIRTEISDRGPGVETLDRIFEPFFTTKEHGMGMGLAVCRSIIESHGGRLWAEKNEPHGARFIFTLPAEAKAAA
ncbi:MAG: PAS domain S-box protein [Mesorhizobium sp.]|uniref:MASE1 domain-containing protein n=1 Tax=Mesorhizobium sp. TaxID=1871066 RepID=UPI0012001480|nr:MASE1 domain-containing protein [Mesorhizobium sp.]TIQ29986.1 MAG: PAS domain S-box protein [Mesorhizobium sp.]